MTLRELIEALQGAEKIAGGDAVVKLNIGCKAITGLVNASRGENGKPGWVYVDSEA